MKNRLFIIILFVIFIVGCSNSIVKDKTTISEINELNSIMFSRNLTSEDLIKIKEISKSDDFAKIFLEEAEWLIKNNQQEHATHPISFLANYIKTGDKYICLPHELSHIELYIKNNDIEFAKTRILLSNEYKLKWEKKVKKSYLKFPQYYPKFNETIFYVNEALIRLNNNQYDERTFELLDFIEKYEVC